MSASTSEPGTLGLIASDIKLAHSIFALPFALLAGVMALPPSLTLARALPLLTLIVVCMVLARTWAMLFNRIVDRDFDRENPRTRRRALASGRLSLRRAWAAALACAGLFVLAAAAFWPTAGNPWPLVLSVPVLAWIAFYSLTKRFTALCHLFLGGALAASPLAAAIAVQPAALVDQPALWWLAGMVLLWVAGFDVIYALADLDFDRERGLRSIPAGLGWRGAVWVSRGLHLSAVASLLTVWLMDPRLGPVFLGSAALVLLLLAVEHSIVARRGREGLQLAFFTLNGVVSCLVGGLGILDVLVIGDRLL
ncbi:MAG: 4-hydroxybenzoate octaprenyltransferase [Phycisphaeraceae bacterium]|nr:4-hydroxybenzoate octaprenyltransferase [Phycisphaeraceae bacterium]